jgi:hypothetical protein
MMLRTAGDLVQQLRRAQQAVWQVSGLQYGII